MRPTSSLLIQDELKRRHGGWLMDAELVDEDMVTSMIAVLAHA